MSDLLGIHKVYRDGHDIGTVNVTQNGLMTLFECECDYKSDGVLRLAGVSGGKYTSLGVLAPEAGILKLKKSFSKSAIVSMRLDIGAGFFAVLSDDIYNNTEKIRPEPKTVSPVADTGEPQEEPENLSVKENEEKPPMRFQEPIPKVTKANILDNMNATENLPEPLRSAEVVKVPPEVPNRKSVPEIVMLPDESNDKKLPSPSEVDKIAPPIRHDTPAPMSEPTQRAEWMPIPDPSVLFNDEDIANACKDATGALTMEKDGVTLLAIPVVPGEPFPMMPVFCFGDSIMLGSREYIVFKSKNGNFVI